MFTKKKLIIIIVVFVLVCIFAGLVFGKVISFNTVKEPESEAYTEPDEVVVDISTERPTHTGQSGLPYLKTDIDGIFFTIDTSGNVSFFEYSEGFFNPLESSGRYSVSVNMSETTIKANVTYLKTDGRLTGYGLYTAENGSYALYPYVFFHLMDYGKNYDGRSGSYVLLADTTADDLYNNEKIYEEPFIYYTSSGNTERYLSEGNRTPGYSGAKRSDYSMLTEELVSDARNYQLFLSGRNYGDLDVRVDLLREGGGGNNIDNIVVASNILANWAKYTDNGNVRYLIKNGANIELREYSFKDKEAKSIKVFENVSESNILINNNILFIKGTGSIYNLLNGNELILSGAQGDVDAVSTDGKIIAVRQYINYTPYMYIYSLSDGAIISSDTNEAYVNAFNICTVGNSLIMLSFAEQEGYTYLIK